MLLKVKVREGKRFGFPKHIKELAPDVSIFKSFSINLAH